MKLKIARDLSLVLFLLGAITLKASAQENVWTPNYSSPTQFATDRAVTRPTFPKQFKLFNLNIEPFRDQLLSVVDKRGGEVSTVISLPNADGGLEQFEIFEASNFEPDLQAQFPEIRAYSGRGMTDRFATVKLSISPKGVQSMVFRTGNENEFMEAYSQDHAVYAVFRGHREKGGLPWACSTQEKNLFASLDSQVQKIDAPQSSTGELKTMRLAQSCNGEYSNFFGAFNAGQVASVLAAFNATLTRANGTYEKDLAIHLNLIAATTSVIFYDPATDPYTTLSNWNNQLQSTLTANVGEANYDIGHMFGASGGGGNAGCIGCVCVDNSKGRGITSPADGIPQGDNFDIDYVVHEVGHQMGANHTFSFQNEGSGVQKEVGSGITIMGYAGITNQDVAPHSIDTFHETSIAQIQANMANKPCPITTVMAANHPPVVASVPNYTIPITTPFTLTGSATDPDGDPLTYQWEQNDNSNTTGNASVASPTKATGPNWISFIPTASPTRTFPRLSTILAGLFVTPTLGGDAVANVEALSSVSRNLNFRLTVRDNRPYVPAATIGQTQFTDMTVTVTNTAGPFQVTSPNTNVSWPGSSAQTVTWDVNNTNAGTVNVSNVMISLSTDGGQTFPTVLAASTANDGSESVTIPEGATTTARMKVEAVGNIFFDISNTNFTITAGGGTPTPTNTPTATPTNTPTATPTNTPTATPTSTPTATPTNTPTSTPTATPTSTPTATPTSTPTSTPTATPTPVTSRNFRVVNSIGSPGGQVTVPVELDSLGNEAATSLSINFDTSILTNPTVAIGNGVPLGTALTPNPNQIAQGRYGVLVDSTNTFTASPPARQVVTFTFTVAPGTPVGTVTNVTFGDQPTVRSTSDSFGNNLTAGYIPGTVTIATAAPLGFEGDVAPRPNGDGIVLATDVTQLRRFSTGLDTPGVATNEGQRADCAPRASSGDGIINAGDVVQGRRYSTGLDPLTTAGGPTTGPVEEAFKAALNDVYAYLFGRELKVASQKADAGSQVVVPVEITPFGDEVAASFTLEYDAAQLSNPRVVLGDGAPAESTLTVNTNENGKVGILVDSTEAMTASAMPKQFVLVTFDVAAGANGEAQVLMTGSLTAQGVSDAYGNTLAARYLGGLVNVAPIR